MFVSNYCNKHPYLFFIDLKDTLYILKPDYLIIYHINWVCTAPLVRKLKSYIENKIHIIIIQQGRKRPLMRSKRRKTKEKKREKKKLRKLWKSVRDLNYGILLVICRP